MAVHGELKPEHAICATNVEAPAISVIELDMQGKKIPTVSVQWYGQVKRQDEMPLPPDCQFQFSIMAAANDIHWALHPERFRVAFLGPVKDWPNDDPVVRQKIADRLTEGSLEGWVIYVCSHHYHLRGDGDGSNPGTFAVTIALLGDPTFGIISPRPFTDLSVLDCPQCT